MNYPFCVEFTIFDENLPITKKQMATKDKLVTTNHPQNDLKRLLQLAVVDSPDIKFLDRLEPAVSSLDEKKQLRMYLFENKQNRYQHSIHFTQQQSQCKEYFSLEELKDIATRVRRELQDYLGYEIDVLIYVDLENL